MARSFLGDSADVLMDALGIEEIPYEELDMTVSALNRERIERGLDSLL